MLALLLSGCLFLSESELQARLALAADANPATDSSFATDTFGGDTAESDSAESETGVPDSAAHPDSGEIADSGDTDIFYTFYRDNDADGSGDPASPLSAYAVPEGYVENAWDCNDYDATEPVWVAMDGFAAGPGTLAEPFLDIPPAVAVALRCMRIRAGTFQANIDLGGHNLDILGVEGSALTWVEAAGPGSVLTVEGGETASVQGLTLTGGTGTSWELESFGGGVIVINPATLAMQDVVITGNSASAGGGGIYSTSPDLTLTDVEISHNDAYAGGGILQVGGQLSATRLQILQNTGGYAVAGYVSSARITMQNSIVNGNRGTVGIDGLYLSAAVAEIINSTIVDHEHGLVVDVGELDSSDLTLQNSIIGGGDFGLLLYGSNVIDVSYTWFFGHSGWDWYPAESNQIGTRGNVSQDPEFVEFTADAVGDNDDLQLAVLSPAVDAGDPAVLDSDGTTSDVGAYGGVEAAW